LLKFQWVKRFRHGVFLDHVPFYFRSIFIACYVVIPTVVGKNVVTPVFAALV